jgi:hypothetical protein
MECVLYDMEEIIGKGIKADEFMHFKGWLGSILGKKNRNILGPFSR